MRKARFHKRHRCTKPSMGACILVSLSIFLCIVFMIFVTASTVAISQLVGLAKTCVVHEDCRTQNPCSMDQCVKQQCKHTPIGGCCIEDDDCGSTACYNAFCDRNTYVCKVTPTPNGTICDDNDDCTVNDKCYDSKCTGSRLTCNTGSTCSSGYCLKGSGCIFTNANDGIECTDNNKCTVGDHCWSGMCASGIQKDCSHYDSECSVGVCDTVTGECKSMARNNNMACDDGGSCTVNDHCQGGTCKGDENTCWDNNPCTINRCVEGIGCMVRHEDFNMTCIQACDCDDKCPDGYTCADGTCVKLDTAGSSIRFLDYEIEQCTNGHRLVMDYVIDSNPYHIGNETRYIYPRSAADFIAMNQDLGFIDEIRNLQTIAHDDYSRTGVTLTTACQNVTQNNCDTIFSMRNYAFYVNVHHCLSTQPSDATCIDPSIQLSASVALSISDCTTFSQRQHIPMYGVGVLYYEGSKYVGLSDALLQEGFVTAGYESPVYNNSVFMSMTTQLRICRATPGHYLYDCVYGADDQCTVTGCYNWDQANSPIAQSFEVVNQSITALAKSSTWNLVSCYKEDNYNEPASVKCEENKCPDTANGIANNFPAMDDGFRMSVFPLKTYGGQTQRWIFDFRFRIYYCGNATNLRSQQSGNDYHSIVSVNV